MFVLDNLGFVLDKNYFVRAEGQGIDFTFKAKSNLFLFDMNFQLINDFISQYYHFLNCISFTFGKNLNEIVHSALHCIVAAVSYLYLIFCRLYLLENQYCFCYSQREVILQSTLWDKKKEDANH